MIATRFGKSPKSNLFESLKPYSIILVSGPHRSGTTIAAVMIGNDLEYGVIEDAQIDVILAVRPLPVGVILHCPSRTHLLHTFTHIPDLAVVMIKRPVEDIIASQRRIGWGFEEFQLDCYREVTPMATNLVPPVSRVKYDYWQTVQKPLLGDRGFEVEYNDLRQHPMWVSKSKREDFTITQVEVGKPFGEPFQNPDLTDNPERAKAIRESWQSSKISD